MCIQWKEAREKEFHLQSEKKASALSNASRKWLLGQETNAALEHEGECPQGLHCYRFLNTLLPRINSTAVFCYFHSDYVGGEMYKGWMGDCRRSWGQSLAIECLPHIRETQAQSQHRPHQAVSEGTSNAPGTAFVHVTVVFGALGLESALFPKNYSDFSKDYALPSSRPQSSNVSSSTGPSSTELT